MGRWQGENVLRRTHALIRMNDMSASVSAYAQQKASSNRSDGVEVGEGLHCRVME